MSALRVCAGPEELAATAARIFWDALADAPPERPFSVVLSGGHTPKLSLRRIAASAPPGTDWSRMHFFWSDERDVPPMDEQSNFRLAQQNLFGAIGLPEGNIHRFRTELRPPERVASALDGELKTYFSALGQTEPRFDLAYLGLGEDGHTASLWLDSEPLLAHTTAAEPWARAVRIPYLNTWRYTLTPWALNAAARIAFLAEGREKAQALAAATRPQGLRAAPSSQPDPLPARWIEPRDGQLVWLADREAASGLIPRPYVAPPTP